MPSIAKTGPSLFLGIELGVDQLRASIVDESLELVGVESVDFDTEMAEYKCVTVPSNCALFSQRPSLICCSFYVLRIQGGIFTTPGEAYTTPVEMWLKSLGEN